MRVKVNLGKYANKRYEFHTAKDLGESVQKNPEEIERLNKKKDICLNCTKKKCTGTDRCFEKERNKHDQD